MTDFSNLSPLGPTGTFSSTPKSVDRSAEEPWYDRAFYWIAETTGEEFAAKTLGSLLGAGPRYQFGADSSNLQDQANLTNLIRDLSNQQTISDALLHGQKDVKMGIGTAAAGTALAILNPADILNKLKVAKLTRLGRGLSRAKQLAEPFLTVDKTTGLFKVNVAALRSSKEGYLASAALEGTTKQAAKEYKLAAVNRQAQIEDFTTVEKALNKAKKKHNLTLQDVIDSSDVFKRAVRSETAAVGFSHPLKFGQADLFNVGKGRGLLDDSVAVKLPEFINESLLKIGSKLQDAGGVISTSARRLMKAGGYEVPETAGEIKLDQTLSRALNKLRNGEQAEILDETLEALRNYVKSGGTKLRAEEITRRLETPFTEVDLAELEKAQFSQILEELPQDFWEVNWNKGLTELELDNLQELIRGTDLTPDRSLALFKGEIGPSEIRGAIEAFENAPRTVFTGKEGITSKLHNGVIVVKAPEHSGFKLENLKTTDKVLGIPKFTPVENGKYLVGKVRPQSKYMATPDGDPGGIFFDTTHARNLELLSAQLSTRKPALTLSDDLLPSDLLITHDGLVDLINPNVIVPAKGLKQARKANQEVIQRFLDRYSDFNSTNYHFDYLPTSKATTEAAKNALREVRLKNSYIARSVSASKDTDLVLMRANTLLQDTVNSRIQQAVAENRLDVINPDIVDSAVQNVEAQRARIRRQLDSPHETLSLEPVEIALDEAGNPEVVRGLDLIAAASMEGLPVLPVKRVAHTGDIIEAGKFPVGSYTRLDKIHFGDGRQAVNLDIKEIDTQSVLNSSYKLNDIDSKPLFLSPGQIDTTEFLEGLGDLIATKTPTLKARKTALLKNKLTGTYGKADLGGVSLAETLETIDLAESGAHKAFIKAIEQSTGLSLEALYDVRIANNLLNKAKDLQRTASATLDRLASNGVFTSRMLESSRINLFDGIVEHLSNQSDALQYHSKSLSSSDLRNFSKKSLSTHGSLEEVQPSGRLIFAGYDEATSATVEQITDITRPRLVEGIRPRKSHKISEARKAELETQGIYYNKIPSDKITHKIGTKRVRVNSFYLTEGRGLYYGTDVRHQSPRNLLKDIWGEGQVPRGDWGQVTTEDVHLWSNIGSTFRTLTKRNLNSLEENLRQTAQKLLDAGVDGSKPLDIRVPWEEIGWSEVYGTNRTVSNVASKDFRLKLPRNLNGASLTLSVDAPHFATYVRANRSGLTAAERDVFDFISELNPELLKAEVERHLPITRRTGYLHRVLDPRASKALAKYNAAKKATEVFNVDGTKHVKSVTAPERFIKERSLTDLTTEQYNEIIKELRGKDPFLEVIKEKVSDQELHVLGQISEALNAGDLPTDIDFFVMDPFQRAVHRVLESFKARERQLVLETVPSVRVTGAQLQGFKAGRETLSKLDKAKIKLNTEKVRIQDEIAKLEEGSPSAEALSGTEELYTELERLNKGIGDIESKRISTIEDIATKYGSEGIEVNPKSDSFYVAGHTAQKLLRDGKISATDILSPGEDALVKVPSNKVLSHIKDTDEAFYFTDEGIAVIDKHFKSTRRASDFNRVLGYFDQVQSAWKQITLFPIPLPGFKYHTRNIVSNAWMGWMGGVRQSAYREANQVISVIRRRASGAIPTKEAEETLSKIVFSDDTGNVISGQDLWDNFVEQGGPQSTLIANEFGLNKLGDVSDEFTKLYTKAGFEPSANTFKDSSIVSKLTKGSQKFGRKVEDWFRFGAFLDGWKKTGDFQQAGLNVKKIFYNYGDLNAFERRVLRRWLPFYSWSRHNIPRMIELAWTEPVRLYRAKQLVSNIARGSYDIDEFFNPEDLTSYLESRGGFPVAKRSDGTYTVAILDSVIPIYDLVKLGSPLKFATDSLTPFIKYPIEEIANVNLFTGRKLEEFPGQQASSYTLRAIGAGKSSFGSTGNPIEALFKSINNEHFIRTFFRPGSEAAKLGDAFLQEENFRGTKPSLFIAGLDALAMKLYINDPEKAREWRNRDWQKIKNALTYQIKKLEDAGDTSSATAAKKMLVDHIIQKRPQSE